MTGDRAPNARKGDALPPVHRQAGSIDQFLIVPPRDRTAMRAFGAESFICPERSAKRKEANVMIDTAAGDLHSVTEKVAYAFWERRGRPLGSPEVDWLAAERALASARSYRGLPYYSIQP